MTKPSQLPSLSVNDLETVTGGLLGNTPAERAAWKKINEANRPWRSLPWPGGR